MVNYDKREFTLSQVKPKSSAPRLVGIDSANDCQALIDVATKRLTKGEIVGIGIDGTALLAGAAFAIWQRRHRNSRHERMALSIFPVQASEIEKEGDSANTMELLGDTQIQEADFNGAIHVAEPDSHQQPVEVSGKK